MSYNPYAPPTTESQSPEVHGSAQLASRGDRFVGAFIDGLISLAVNVPLGFGLGVILALFGIDTEGSLVGAGILLFASFIIGFGSFLLVNGYFLSTRGQTLGKMVVGTQIVSDDNQLVPIVPLVLKRYLWLWVLSLYPVLGGIAGLVNALLIFRSNKKCLHDDIAGTKVIKL